MASIPLFPSRGFRSVLLASAACLLWIQSAFADPTVPNNTVKYDPANPQYNGQLPITFTFPINITAPSVLGQSATVAVSAIATKFPTGADVGTASSWVSLSAASLTFVANETHSVIVTIALPANAPIGGDGAYAFKIIATGWPSESALYNNGTDVNITVTKASTPSIAPEVKISTPQEGETIHLSALGQSVSFAFEVNDKNTPAGNIIGVTWQLDGSSAPITVTPVGLNTPNVTGNGTVKLSSPGQHQITVKGTSQPGGSTTTTHTFFVEVPGVPSPTVTLAFNSPEENAEFTAPAGGTTAVPFTFTATASGGLVSAAAYQVDGGPITYVVGLNPDVSVQISASATNLGAGSHYVTAYAWNGSLAATPKTLKFVVKSAPKLNQTVTVADVTKTYGDSAFAIAATASSGLPVTVTLVNSALGDDPTIAVWNATTSKFEIKGTGTATIRADVAGNAAYNPASATAKLTINKAPLKITAQNYSKVYGAAVPALAAVSPIDTLVYGETLASLGLTVTVTTTATSSSPVGDYSTTPKLNATPANYTVTLVDGKLTVTPAPLTITASAGSKTVGEADPELKYSVVGLLGSDQLNGALKRVAGETVGFYDITQGTLAAGDNYTVVTFNSAKFEIKAIPPPVNITISGSVFLDVSDYGTRNPNEPGLSLIPVVLTRTSPTPATTATVLTTNGAFSFTVSAGNYSVKVGVPTGMTATTPVLFTVAQTTVLAPVGLKLDFTAISKLKGDGMSQGYWKENLSKNIANSNKGIQESFEDLVDYTNDIRAFRRPRTNPAFNLPLATKTSRASLSVPAAVFGSKDQLELQLLASEYNFTSGRLIGGSDVLTFAFLTWGEYEAISGTTTSRGSAAKWFDAFNTSHGGLVGSP